MRGGFMYMKRPFIKLKNTSVEGLGPILQLFNDNINFINYNLETIYELLAEKEVKVDTQIEKVAPTCASCRYHLYSTMSCNCYCHKLAFTVNNPNSTLRGDGIVPVTLI